MGFLGLGFLLGLKHALDADHIAAVSTIVSSSKKISQSSVIGAIWGLGHTLALLVAGAIILLFKIAIPLNVALVLELFIGIMLVYLGINVMIKLKTEKIHVHIHEHQGSKHIHLHSHKHSKDHAHAHKKSFLIGIMHGLAGSAAIMLVVLASAKNMLDGFLYILSFGLGSIISMLLISTMIGIPFSKIQKGHNYLSFSAGALSIILGIIIVINSYIAL